jgi:hypothetical protein
MDKKSTSHSQVAAFRKAARELGCDESEERFQDALRVVGRQRPKDMTQAEADELAKLVEKGDPGDLERMAELLGQNEPGPAKKPDK